MNWPKPICHGRRLTSMALWDRSQSWRASSSSCDEIRWAVFCILCSEGIGGKPRIEHAAIERAAQGGRGR